MAETWIDARNGELLIGREAAADRIDEAGPDIMPLAELLDAKNFPFKNGDFQVAQPREWSREALITTGKWTLNLIARGEIPEGDPPVLTRKYLERMHILRLFPTREALSKAGFELMWQFREALGAEVGMSRKRYNDWTIADYVSHAQKLATRLKRRPRREDYKASVGPNLNQIRERVGGVAELNQLIGYPNVYAMDEDDYIDWGVRVVEANPRHTLTRTLVRALSKKDRGPVDSTLHKTFRGFPIYKEKVYERYEQQQKERARAREMKLEAYGQLQTESIFSGKSTRIAKSLEGLSDDEAVQFIAKYWVTGKCLPDASMAARARIALKKNSFVVSVRRYLQVRGSDIQPPDIEIAAIRLGVFDDIWPMDAGLENLRVTDEELEAVWRRDRQRIRKYRQQARGQKT